jgi:hypothetical protein
LSYKPFHICKDKVWGYKNLNLIERRWSAGRFVAELGKVLKYAAEKPYSKFNDCRADTSWRLGEQGKR